MERCSKTIIRYAFLLLLSACTTIPLHNAVPEPVSTQASISGFPANIRFWADEAPPNIGGLIKERLAAYRTANQTYFEKHHAYPALHYLAISGGAYDGAFGAGLLSGWSQTGKRPDFELVTGISTGALIAPFVFIGPEYDAKIKELFTTTNSDNIFMSSAWNVLGGITGGLALTDNAPLAKKIEEAITPEIMVKVAAEHHKGKRLFIGTTNIEAQRGVIWDIGTIASSGSVYNPPPPPSSNAKNARGTILGQFKKIRLKYWQTLTTHKIL